MPPRRVRDYRQLRALFDERRIELGMSMGDVDSHADFRPGFFAWSMRGRHSLLGPHLGKILAALGMELCLVPTGARVEMPARKVTKCSWSRDAA
jgi:hypothetical protein